MSRILRVFISMSLLVVFICLIGCTNVSKYEPNEKTDTEVTQVEIVIPERGIKYS